MTIIKKLYPLPSTLYPNQKGISSLVLLFIIVLGVFLIWETNEYVTKYAANPEPLSTSENDPTTTYCKTGETDNCNDSNDQFLYTE